MQNCVPLEYLKLFRKYKDLQKEDWNNVVDTLTLKVKKGSISTMTLYYRG